MSADESITELAAAVAELGALPMPVPVGPEPQEADADVVAARAAQVISAMGAELRGLKKESDRLFLAWGSARMRSRRKNEALKKLKARVAELEAERHSTNEALDDAVQQRRADQEAFEAVRALCDAADYAGIVSGGWFTVEAIRKALRLAAPGPDAVTKAFSPVASLREPDGEHYPHVHHDYRKGRDLDLPQTGGTQGAEPDEDRLLDCDELRRAVRGHLFGGGS